MGKRKSASDALVLKGLLVEQDEKLALVRLLFLLCGSTCGMRRGESGAHIQPHVIVIVIIIVKKNAHLESHTASTSTQTCTRARSRVFLTHKPFNKKV